MSDQKGSITEPAEAPKPGELFAQCQAGERTLSKARIKAEWPSIVKEEILAPSLFVGWRPNGKAYSHNDKYPFGFSIMLPRTVTAPSSTLERRGVVHYLKKLPTVELRLLLVARWLRDNGVCEPEEILPAGVVKYLIKVFKKERGISFTDIYYAKLIKNWLPYFERLLEDRPQVSGTSHLGLTQWLIKQGHDRSAVECAMGSKRNKRSALSIGCEWLVRREDIRDIKAEADAGTLRNAYSRVYGKPRQKPPTNPS